MNYAHILQETDLNDAVLHHSKARTLPGVSEGCEGMHSKEETLVDFPCKFCSPRVPDSAAVARRSRRRCTNKYPKFNTFKALLLFCSRSRLNDVNESWEGVGRLGDVVGVMNNLIVGPEASRVRGAAAVAR